MRILFGRLISTFFFGAPAIVGDITPSDNVPKEEKSRMEKEALDHMCELLGGGPRGEYKIFKSKTLTFCAVGILACYHPIEFVFSQYVVCEMNAVL